MDELEAAKRERLGKAKTIEGFIKDIATRPLALTEFDEKLWLAVIDTAKVARDGGVTFRFRNGTEVIVYHCKVAKGYTAHLRVGYLSVVTI